MLTHELAHEMTHKTKERRNLSKAVLETEAEAVAYAVCQSVGLDAIGAARDYIQLWDGDKKTLAASLERIRSVAGEIIGAVQPNMSSAAASSNQRTTDEIMDTAGDGGQAAEA